jgi:drug/metabolite transporter (DMT)-like permease
MLYDTTGASGYLPIPRSESDWLALSSGITFAVANVITRKSHHLSVLAKSYAVWLGVIAMSIICIPIFGETLPAPSFFSLKDWLILTLISFVLVFGTYLAQYGVTKMAANRASVIFLFELIVAAIASYYLANEVMKPYEWVGGLLIVTAAFMAATSKTQD